MKKYAASAKFNSYTKEIELEREPDSDKQPVGFKFSGTDSLGRTISNGFVPFDTKEISKERLLIAGINLDELLPVYRKKNITFGEKLPTREELAQFAEAFGELIEVGMSHHMVCLEMAKNASNEILKKALEDIADRIFQGQNLADAFASQVTEKGQAVFPITLTYALKTGLKIGAAKDLESNEKRTSSLLMVLRDFANNQKRSAEISGKIKKSLLYPKIVMIGVGIVFIFLVTYMIPMFAGSFKSLLAGKDDSLPFLTQFLLDFSEFFSSPFGIFTAIAIIAGIYFLYRFLFYNPTGIDWKERKALRFPVFGDFYRDYNTALLCRSLSMLWAGEQNIENRFKILGETTEHPEYKEMCEHICNHLIVQGRNPKHMFDGHYFLMGKEFASVMSSIAKGADGQRRLLSYAHLMEKRANDKIDRFLVIIQQFSILIPALMVITIAMAAYLPLFQLIGRIAEK